jgi:hypothetical protein
MEDAVGAADGEFEDVDTFHYVSYICRDGFLWELDGLKKHPIKVCQTTEDSWLQDLQPVLQAKIA